MKVERADLGDALFWGIDLVAKMTSSEAEELLSVLEDVSERHGLSDSLLSLVEGIQRNLRTKDGQ